MDNDTISRQAAIAFVKSIPYIKEHQNMGELIKELIEQIPAIQPEQKMGEWVYGEFDIPHCSICGHDVMPNMVSLYCPNCGAKMEADENDH